MAGDRELTIVLDYKCIRTDDPSYFYYYTGTKLNQSDHDAFAYKFMEKSPYEHNEATSKVKEDYLKLGKSIAFFHYAFKSQNQKEEEGHQIHINECSKIEKVGEENEENKDNIADYFPDIEKPTYPYPLNPSLFDIMAMRNNGDSTIDTEKSIANDIVKHINSIQVDGGTLLDHGMKQQEQKVTGGVGNQLLPNIFIITQPANLSSSESLSNSSSSGSCLSIKESNKYNQVQNNTSVSKRTMSENTVGSNVIHDDNREQFNNLEKPSDSEDGNYHHFMGVNKPPVIEFSSNNSVQAPVFYQPPSSSLHSNDNQFHHSHNPKFYQMQKQQHHSRQNQQYQYTDCQNMQSPSQIHQQQPVIMAMQSSPNFNNTNVDPNLNRDGLRHHQENVVFDTGYPPQLMQQQQPVQTKYAYKPQHQYQRRSSIATASMLPVKHQEEMMRYSSPHQSYYQDPVEMKPVFSCQPVKRAQAPQRPVSISRQRQHVQRQYFDAHNDRGDDIFMDDRYYNAGENDEFIVDEDTGFMSMQQNSHSRKRPWLIRASGGRFKRRCRGGIHPPKLTKYDEFDAEDSWIEEDQNEDDYHENGHCINVPALQQQKSIGSRRIHTMHRGQPYLQQANDVKEQSEHELISKKVAQTDQQQYQQNDSSALSEINQKFEMLINTIQKQQHQQPPQVTSNETDKEQEQQQQQVIQEGKINRPGKVDEARLSAIEQKLEQIVKTQQQQYLNKESMEIDASIQMENPQTEEKQPKKKKMVTDEMIEKRVTELNELIAERTEANALLHNAVGILPKGKITICKGNEKYDVNSAIKLSSSDSEVEEEGRGGEEMDTDGDNALVQGKYSYQQQQQKNNGSQVSGYNLRSRNSEQSVMSDIDRMNVIENAVANFDVMGVMMN